MPEGIREYPKPELDKWPMVLESLERHINPDLNSDVAALSIEEIREIMKKDSLIYGQVVNFFARLEVAYSQAHLPQAEHTNHKEIFIDTVNRILHGIEDDEAPPTPGSAAVLNRPMPFRATGKEPSRRRFFPIQASTTPRPKEEPVSNTVPASTSGVSAATEIGEHGDTEIARQIDELITGCLGPGPVTTVSRAPGRLSAAWSYPVLVVNKSYREIKRLMKLHPALKIEVRNELRARQEKLNSANTGAFETEMHAYINNWENRVRVNRPYERKLNHLYKYLFGESINK